MIDKLGGRKNILVWGLIILNFYLVVTHNELSTEFMTWSAAVAGIGVGGNVLSKVVNNQEPSVKLTTTETPTMTQTTAEVPTEKKELND